MVCFGRWLKLMALSYAKVVRPGKKGRHSTRYLQGYLGKVGRPAICGDIYIWLRVGQPAICEEIYLCLRVGQPAICEHIYIFLRVGQPAIRKHIYMWVIFASIYIFR